MNRKASRINIPLVIKRHYLKVLLLGGLTFAAVAPLLVLTAKESYSALIELRIDPMRASVVTGVDYTSNWISQYYSEYVATQKFKILKRQNVLRALSELDPVSRNAMIGAAPLSDLTVSKVIEGIQVLPARDSLILTVQIQGQNPQGLAEFLNQLITIYLSELSNEKGTTETNRINFTDQQKSTLETEIATINARIRQISEDIGTGNFSSDDIPYKIELKIQEQEAIVAENDRILKEKRYNEFLKTMYKTGSVGMDSQIEQKLSADPFHVEQKRLLLAKVDALSTQLNSLSLQNVGRKELEENIAKVQAQILDLDAKGRERVKKLIDSETAGTQDRLRLQLLNDFVVAREYEDAVKRSYKNVQEKYAFISKRVLEGQSLQRDLENLKTQLGKVTETKAMLQGDLQSSGNVAVENYAKPPVSPDKSSLMKNLGFAFVLSFFWIIAVIVLYEITDQRIKSPEELKSFSGIKPSWPISNYSGSLLSVSLQDRDSVAYKAIQSLATRINQERQNFQVKVVTFTGLSSMTGTTDILLNCAHAMTDSCERILVVDFNFTRPGIAQKLAIPLKVQPPAKSLDSAPLESVVYMDLARGIDVLAIRNLDKLENKVVDRVVEWARERYDIIFIDSPPILSSSKTEHLFLQSDSAVFVVRGNFNTYPDLQHTLELAGKFGIESAALVLNWWKPNHKHEAPDQETTQAT